MSFQPPVGGPNHVIDKKQKKQSNEKKARVHLLWTLLALWVSNVVGTQAVPTANRTNLLAPASRCFSLADIFLGIS